MLREAAALATAEAGGKVRRRRRRRRRTGILILGMGLASLPSSQAFSVERMMQSTTPFSSSSASTARGRRKGGVCPSSSSLYAFSHRKSSSPLVTLAASKGGNGGGAGGVRSSEEEEEEEEEREIDDLADEVDEIVGVSREKGRPIRKNKSPIMDWLKDLYQNIFWFGLDVDDEDDYYLDEIDWLGEWSSPLKVAGGWEEFEQEDDELLLEDKDEGGGGKRQSIFRGAFPFDRQTYPIKKKKSQLEKEGDEREGGTGDDITNKKRKKEAVWRRMGDREEIALWKNVDSSDSRKKGGGGGGVKAFPRPRRRDEDEEEEGPRLGVKEMTMQELEERKGVLMVSKEVWKKRIADMLRAGETEGSKLSKARARLQEVDQELGEVELMMKELRIVREANKKQKKQQRAEKEEEEEEEEEEEDDATRI